MCLQRLHVFQLYYHKQGQKSKPGNHPVVDVDNDTDGRGGDDDVDVDDDNIDADVPLQSAGAYTHTPTGAVAGSLRVGKMRKMCAQHIFKWS